ncbi:AMP-binding protein [Streptomyces sp. NPDC007929]|uniref:AMP-binding protein n=1 Tax=unclassified Streptomyces TaxID=2593676 RepID=UPI0036E67471
MSRTRPIGRIIRELAERSPDRPAVTCGAETITRGELERRSNQLARAYAGLGVRHGDLVTIGLPNSVEFFLAVVATWKLGAIPQPVSWRLPALERQAIVDLADSALVVGCDATDHPYRTCLPSGFSPAPSLADTALEDRVSPSWKAPTSGGSTGRPKLIVDGLSGDFDAELGSGLHMRPDDCQLVAGPLYHNGPFSFAFLGLFIGHHLVVLPRFDAAEAIETITARSVAWTMMVPTMMQRILRTVQERDTVPDLSCLRILLHTAAACPEWVKEGWIELIGAERLWEIYSGTESQAMTAINGAEWLQHRGSVGKPVQGEMIIMGSDGKPVPPGTVGDIYMRRPPGPAPSYRYVGAKAQVRDGWESLGDLGWMDEDGYLYLSDRRTDLIVSGGSNVYPAEVEAALTQHPAVLTSVVVGLPDPDLGQRVHAVVEVLGEVTPDELFEHLSLRLVRYKVPRTIEFSAEPLRDDAGKARRSAVRDRVIERLSSPPHSGGIHEFAG